MPGRALYPGGRGNGRNENDYDLPRPTLRFRLEAWRRFQRAIDPLGKPRPYRAPERWG